MIRNCPRTPAPSPRSVELPDGVETGGLGVALECLRTWERLEPTEQPGVRRCGACEERVYESWSEEEARAHIEQGRCVVQMFISLSARGDASWTWPRHGGTRARGRMNSRCRTAAWPISSTCTTTRSR